MAFPRVTIAEWRAQVEKELGAVPFDKALVHTTPEGLPIQPLYTEPLPGAAPIVRPSPAPFAVCMPLDGSDKLPLAEAEALWLRAGDDLARLFADPAARRLFFVVDSDGAPAVELARLADAAARHGVAAAELRFLLAADPIGAIARGRADAAGLPAAFAELARGARLVASSHPLGHGVLVSTLPVHDAGADAADELAVALSTGAAYLGALLDAGFDAGAAARQIAVQVAVGRDTFGELCKLRALRLVWHKLFAAAGAADAPLALLHAVGSARTLSERDPWVNMLRATTQSFAAILGGADLVTPTSFDEAAGTAGALGRRVARNTGLVLREESQLGRVRDPAAGSYYLESRTDALAREAWQRFRTLERDGGVARALADGSLRARLDAAWSQRRDAIAKRKEPITGVSEFANLDEKRLPQPDHVSPPSAGLPRHRDAEAFEALRDRADALGAEAPAVALISIGPAAEHRARLAFAAGFFATGGLRARAASDGEPATVACLVGSDERYVTEAAPAARALKAAGVARVLLAGRPGALEPELRAAGVDGFVFVGCDVVAALADLLGARA
jgi:methylmalonyl-CoA mutase